MLHRIFEEQVKRFPEQIAVKTKDQELTYACLNRAANQVAHQIIQLGSQQTVLLLFEHGVDMIVGLLGAVKAGQIYVPLDPAYPEERLQYILHHSQAELIITNTRNDQLAKQMIAGEQRDLPILNIDRIEESGSTANPDLEVAEDQIAYILYTSGSTGLPKGIMQSYRNIYHFIQGYTNDLGLVASDRLTLFSVFSHDAAVMDIYSGLLNGATLYPVNLKEQRNLLELADWLKSEKITMYHSVPTVFRHFCRTLVERGEALFPDLRYIVLGGEEVIGHDILQFQELFAAHTVLVNLYGQSESSYNSAQFITHDTSANKITLGECTQDTEIIVVNEEGEEVSLLETGEIVVASPYVALGYWNDPERTRKAFTTDPELGHVYWTGDLGRLNVDGSIKFIGRKDFQVKIRGFRVELGEIESQLLKDPGIKEAVVIAKTDEMGHTDLCAFLVATTEVSEAELNQDLFMHLPDYMIPTYWTFLPAFPKTPTGKTDRNALANMEIAGQKAAYVPPTDEVEEKLVAIWQELLKAERVGIRDHFFKLGGQSLKATFLIAKIAKVFHVEISLREIFLKPTIQELAELIRKTNLKTHTVIKRVEEQEVYPLSSAQKRLFILNQLEEGGIGYNIPGVIQIQGELNRYQLESALRKVIQRHESLRTSFELQHGEPVQRIHEQVPFHLQYEEASAADVKKIVDAFIQPFDLRQAPLLRVALVKMEDSYLFLYDMHHMITDGMSMGIFFEDWMQFYQGHKLPELKIQYKDFAFWQNEFFQSEVMQKQEEYWLQIFSGEIPVLELPTDYPRPAVMTTVGASLEFTVEQELAQELGALARQTQTTLFMQLLAAYTIVLAKYTGQEDLVIGTPVAGRKHVDLENLIGMFVNTLALRNQPRSNLTYRQFLAHVRENTLQAYENQDYQFEMLVEKLNLHRDLSRNALFDTMLTLQNMNRVSGEIDGLQFVPYDLEMNRAKFDLELMAWELPTGIEFSLEYSTHLFTKQSVERLANHFINLIRQIVQNPDRPLGELSLMSPEEERELIYGFNHTTAEIADLSIYQFIEIKASQYPERIALEFAGEKMTYGELNERANQLARILRKQGIRPDQLVGILLHRSPGMVESMLAVWKAGGAYIPIDPEYPENRIQGILEDSQARVLLTQTDLFDLSLTKKYRGQVIHLDAADAQIRQEKTENLNLALDLQHLAYVIYTSGSTGKPKGAMVEHIGMMNHIQAKITDLQIHEQCRVAQNASHCFDISVWQFFVALTVGGTTIIYPQELVMEPEIFVDRIVLDRLTILEVVPSFLTEMLGILEARKVPLETLETLLVTGETVRINLMKRWFTLYPTIKVVNAYGPTEASDDITHFIMTDVPKTNSVSIGSPIQNFRIYIVDNQMRLCPVGVKGEICVAGVGVGRGYLNDPLRTAKVFMDRDPFTDLPGRMYRTGDLGRWLPDGTIEFFGRKDYQVKIRGYRIELGEIESQLVNHPAVKEVVVIDKEDDHGNPYLCAYYVAHTEIEDSLLRQFLLEHLPDYMVPAYFIRLHQLPLSANGKIDRKALPEEKKIESSTYVAPENEVERRLVGIWKETLGIERVGTRDNFFELGGYSLKAMQLISKVYCEWDVQLPLREVFHAPTIQEMAKTIQIFKDYEDHWVQTPYTLLNEDQERKLFAFPPISGFGLAYTDLAKKISSHAIYSFDFISSEERIREYVDWILQIQDTGPYLLFGYSAGGTLAFEVAKALMEDGHIVTDIMMLDAPRRQQIVEESAERIEENIAKTVEQAMETPMKEYLSIKAIRDQVKTRMRDYFHYDHQLINTGKLHLTNIHYIKAEDTEQAVAGPSWMKSTSGIVVEYQGSGLHKHMLVGDDGEANTQIITEILQSLNHVHSESRLEPNCEMLVSIES